MPILNEDQILSKFIDSKNIDLWNHLSQEYNIIVNDDYQLYELKYLKGDSSAVILTNKSDNRELFTHELLHLELRSFGLNTLEYFEKMSSPLISTLVVGICNCIEHVLIFDRFIDLGYKDFEFTMDYFTSIENINKAKEVYDFANSSRKEMFHLTIFSLYWTFKNEEYIGKDRLKSLSWLKKLQPSLYSKCESMYSDIIDLDLDSDNVQLEFNSLAKKYLRRNY